MNLRWLAAVLIIHVLLWLLLKPPVPHSDDLVYVEEGFRMASPDYTISESPKSHRFLVIIPVAVFVKLFGYSPFIVSLWPLLCSLMTIAGVYLLFRKNLSVALPASLIISCNIIQVIYSTVAFPDAVVSLFAFMAIALMHFRHQINSWVAFVTVAIILAGFFAKQIMLLIIPFIVFASREDISRKRNRLYWKRFYVASLLAVITVLLVSKGLTGQWFFLIQSVEVYHNDVFVSLTAQELLYRLTAEPMVFLFSQAGYWPLLLMAWPAFFLKEGTLSSWKKYAAILFVLLWFGTTSFNRWAPLPLIDRMWMMMIVPLSIMAAYSMNAFLQKKLSPKIRVMFYGMFIVSAFVAFPVFQLTRSLMLLMFAVGFFIAEKRETNKSGKDISMIAAMLPSVILVIWFVLKNSNW